MGARIGRPGRVSNLQPDNSGCEEAHRGDNDTNTLFSVE